jgi:hypothetical protein
MSDLVRPCILTGSVGEDPDDCTTHDHERLRLPPDRLIENFEEAAFGRNDSSISDCVWDIIYDILDSVKLALGDAPNAEEVMETVEDYLTNSYGEL